MTLAGCGGGDRDAAGDTPTLETDTVETSSDDTASVEPASLDPSALPPPGEARVEVDGETFVLRPSGSVFFTCEVGEEQALVNYQQTEAGDLSVQASVLDGAWLGTITFAPTGLDNYGASVRSDGTLAVGEGALTYAGSLTYRSLSDPTNTRDVEARIAVNCGPSGSGGTRGVEATAEIDGRTFSFPASGAQSFECEVGPTGVRVLVNHLSLEDSQIQIEASQQAGGWVGGVYVISGTDRYNGIVPPDGTGLEIVGTTLTFAGAFTHTSGTDPAVEQEVAGSASVTCP